MVENREEETSRVKFLSVARAVQLVNIKSDVRANVQVRDLMMFIEARNVVAAEGRGDLQGGTVLPVPAQEAKPKGRRLANARRNA